MKDCECEGISAEDRAFLDYLEKSFAAYPNRRVAARFGAAVNKRRLAGLGPGRMLRYRRHASGEGFAAEAGTRDEIMKSAPPGDPCCEWEWDPDSNQFICIGWC
jgi:hypothetical protein